MILLFLFYFIIDIIKCQCIVENQSVDWWISYKLPITVRSLGDEYIYITSNKKKWLQSNIPFGSLGSLQTIVNTTKSFFYNDQISGRSVSSSKAHAKGFILLNEHENISTWIIHSLPNFPYKNSQGEYATNLRDEQKKYAQMMLCITIVGVGKLFDTFSQTIFMNVNDMNKTKANISSEVLLLFNQNYLTSKRQLSDNIVHVAKKALFNQKDIYEFVLKNITENKFLYTQTWQCGDGGVLKSSCFNNFSILNIKQTKWPNGLLIPNHLDHTKWAVSNIDWVCIGDLNRMTSQLSRPGGVLCIRDKELADEFLNLIDKYEKCI